MKTKQEPAENPNKEDGFTPDDSEKEWERFREGMKVVASVPKTKVDSAIEAEREKRITTKERFDK